ncbi:MAG TPA: IS200/IS605 family transposase [Planctomycetota bacterium]|nr:IS200/IS605 family transposase [Planctomycetota bacterium]
MPQSLANLVIHVIFSTKNREPLIDLEIEPELHSYLATALKTAGSPAIKVGGPSDHVHILCNLSRTIAVADLVEGIKTDSSKWMKKKGKSYARFYWQNGYGAFSVSQSQVESVKRYIANQREHHKKQTFQEEYREILNNSGIAFDEQYVWD